MVLPLVTRPNSYPRISAFNQFSHAPLVCEDGSMESTSGSTSSNSHDILPASPERGSNYNRGSKHNEEEILKHNLHVRQNFSTDRGGYIPPNTRTKALPLRQRPTPEQSVPPTPRLAQKTSRDEAPSLLPINAEEKSSDEFTDNDDMPFDCAPSKPQRSMSESQISGSQQHSSDATLARTGRSSPPRDESMLRTPVSGRGIGWNNSWEHEQNFTKRDLKVERFMGPPRFSDPKLLEDYKVPTEYNSRPFPAQKVRKAIAGIPAVRRYEEQDSHQIDDQRDDSRLCTNRANRTTCTLVEETLPDEDSLFDFDEGSPSASAELEQKPSKSPQKMRRRSRHLGTGNNDSDSEGSSIDQNESRRPSPATLQERAQQAWRSRRQKVSNMRAKQDIRMPSLKSKPDLLVQNSKPKSDLVVSNVKSKSDLLVKYSKPKPNLVVQRSKSMEDIRVAESKSNQDHPVSNLKSKQDPRRVKAGNVSFGASDIVHHFEPEPQSQEEEEEDDDDDESTCTSFDDKSLNSEYTKTLESEVEDMIKDIFFIGNSKASKPGRRKYKYKPEVKRKMKIKQDVSKSEKKETRGIDSNDEEDISAVSKFRVSINEYSRRKNLDDNLEVAEETESGRSQHAEEPSSDQDDNSDSHHRYESSNDKKKEREKDPFSAVWSFVEGGVSAVTAAFGIGPAEEDDLNDETRPATSNPGDCNVGLLSFETCTGKATHEPIPKPGLQKMLDQAQDFLYGPMVEAGSVQSAQSYLNSGSVSGSDVSGSKDFSLENEEELSLDQLENDPRLVQLAYHAAKSLHQLKGVEFDESVNIDMHSHVKISTVELTLPLGLIFLENNGGCFVTKVSPDGSAARSGCVKVGDQLASINGTNSLKMKVDGICELIKNSPDPKCIKLVFLRYIGPFRPKKSNTQANLEKLHVHLANSELAKSKEESGGQAKKGRFRFFGMGKKKTTAKK